MFDGSSIAGWKDISQSDMALMPDPDTATLDPFFAQTTMAIVCDIIEPTTGELYERDPRGTARKAEAYLQQTGIGDTAYFGPEAEFFIFDDVRFASDPYNCGFKVDSTELPTNTDTEYEMGNLGHRPRMKGGYFPVPPVDSCQDIRSEMLSVMAEMGVTVEKHHHEVGAAQHELGMKFDSAGQVLTDCRSINMSSTMYRHAYGKTATFMPKPVFGDNGTGMHVPPVDLEGRQAALRRQQICRPVRDLPLLYRRHSETRQTAERFHQPVDQLLQASGAGL